MPLCHSITKNNLELRLAENTLFCACAFNFAFYSGYAKSRFYVLFCNTLLSMMSFLISINTPFKRCVHLVLFSGALNLYVNKLWKIMLHANNRIKKCLFSTKCIWYGTQYFHNLTIDYKKTIWLLIQFCYHI